MVDLDGIKLTKTTNSFCLSSSNAWVYFYNENNQKDFTMTMAFGDDGNRLISFDHYKNGMLHFYPGLGACLSGENIIVMPDGSIHECLFKNGNLLYKNRLCGKRKLPLFLAPSFESISFATQESIKNGIKLVFPESENSIEAKIENGDFTVKLVLNCREMWFISRKEETMISIAFDNDDESLEINGFDYASDGSFSWFAPYDKEFPEDERDESMAKPLLKDVGNEKIEELVAYLDKKQKTIQ